MGPSATRQDLQGVVDNAKNTLLDRLAQRNYIHALNESVRNSILHKMSELHVENQIVIRNGQQQREMLIQRISGLESQLKAVQQTLLRILEQQQHRN